MYRGRTACKAHAISSDRAQKFDLGVGVLRKSDNTSHEFATVVEAGKGLGANCYYPHPGGDDTFVELTGELIFGQKPPPHVCGVQTVGGSGALRVVAELLVSQGLKTMLIPDPSWANHRPLLQGGGLTIEDYPYFNQATHTVNIDAMIAALEAAPARTSIMLQVPLNPTPQTLHPKP